MAVGVNITEAKSRLQATGEGGGTWCRLGMWNQPEKGLRTGLIRLDFMPEAPGSHYD